MNYKLVLGGIVLIGIIVVIATSIFLGNNNSDSDPVEQEEFVVTRPAVKPVANTFSVMTPEERVAAQEAERAAAEAAALAASSTASTTATSSATSTDDTTDGE